MKIFFSYKENGDFDGFYNDEIFKEIPSNTVEITNELWNHMSYGIFKLKIDKLNEITKPLSLEDKENYFEEIQEEENKFLNLDEESAKEIAKLKIENQKKDFMLLQLSKSVNQLKIEINKLGGKNDGIL